MTSIILQDQDTELIKTSISATRTMLLLVGMWWRQFWKLGYEDDDPDVLGRQDDQDQEHLTLFSFRRSWGSMYICLVGLAHHRGHLALYSCVGNISIFNLKIVAHCPSLSPFSFISSTWILYFPEFSSSQTLSSCWYFFLYLISKLTHLQPPRYVPASASHAVVCTPVAQRSSTAFVVVVRPRREDIL